MFGRWRYADARQLDRETAVNLRKYVDCLRPVPCTASEYLHAGLTAVIEAVAFGAVSPRGSLGFSVYGIPSLFSSSKRGLLMSGAQAVWSTLVHKDTPLSTGMDLFSLLALISAQGLRPSWQPIFATNLPAGSLVLTLLSTICGEKRLVPEIPTYDLQEAMESGYPIQQTSMLDAMISDTSLLQVAFDFTTDFIVPVIEFVKSKAQASFKRGTGVQIAFDIDDFLSKLKLSDFERVAIKDNCNCYKCGVKTPVICYTLRENSDNNHEYSKIKLKHFCYICIAVTTIQ